MVQKKNGSKEAQANGSKATIAIALVTSLFFVWGLTMNLVNGLNSPMQQYLDLDQTQAALLQVAYFGAYFIMAIPASLIAKRYGYKGGVIVGLVLFVIGSFVTIPATNIASFALFLLSMFIIAAGAASLEVNCNPYITKLGDEKHESMRLNLAQSFNGIGSIVAPLILAQITASVAAAPESLQTSTFLQDTRVLYIIIGIVLAAMLVVFILFKLPEPAANGETDSQSASYASVFKKPHFVLGVIALFLYVGIQTVGFAQISDFAQQQWFGVGEQAAGQLTLMVMTILFTVGRFISVPIIAKVSPSKLLGIYMSAATVCFFIAFLGLHEISVVAMVVAFLFMSIAYPTIFSLALKGLNGAATKTASSILVMSIVGGALIPLLTGAIATATSIVVAMIVCVPCLAYCAWYGFFGSQIGQTERTK